MLTRDDTTIKHRRADVHDANGMSRYRKSAVGVGVLFLAGDVAGALSVLFMSDLLKEPDYLARIAANQNRMVIGALFALLMGLLLAAIPFVMYPIFRRYNEALAMGYVVFRGALETVAYIVGATSTLLLVALSRDYLKAGSPDTAQFGTLARQLKDQGSIATNMTAIVFSLGALMFAYLFYQSRLIPRWLSVWGLVGAPFYLAVPLLSLFHVSAGFLYAPLAAQEIALAIWLIVKGFDASPPDASPALAAGSR